MKNKGIWKIIFIMTGMLFFSLFLITMLNFYKVKKNYLDIHYSIIKSEMEKIKESIESGLKLGLTISDMKNIKDYIADIKNREKDIESIEIFDNRKKIAFYSGIKKLNIKLPEGSYKKIKLYKNTDGGIFVESVFNSLEINSGKIVISFSDKKVDIILEKILKSQIRMFILIFIIASIFLALFTMTIFKKPIEKIGEIEEALTEKFSNDKFEIEKISTKFNYIFDRDMDDLSEALKEKNISKNFFLMMFLIIIISTFFISYSSIKNFDKILFPILKKKNKNINESVVSLIEKACSYGIPFEKLVGVNKYLKSNITKENFLSYFAITNTDGKIIYHYGKIDDNFKKSKYLFINPIKNGGKTLGYLYSKINPSYYYNKYKDIFKDLMTIILISILISIEFLIFLNIYLIKLPLKFLDNIFKAAKNNIFYNPVKLASNNIASNIVEKYENIVKKIAEICQKNQNIEKKPLLENMKLNRKSLNLIRLPFFMFIFSRATSISFFPVYIEKIYKPLFGISKEFATSFSITLFMFFWAISLVPSGKFSEKNGRLKTFKIGALLTGISLILSAFADDYIKLMMARSITAFGFGMVFISVQGFVSDNTDDKTRTTGMAMFQSSFYSGLLCGIAIGSIIFEQTNFTTTFLFSSIFSFISVILLVYFLMEENRDNPKKAKKSNIKNNSLYSNIKLVLLIIFSAIPAKISLTGFYYFLTPLILSSLGNSASDIGRIMIIYGLIQIVVSPMMAKIAKNSRIRLLFIKSGALITSLSFIILYIYTNTLMVFISMILLGIAHSLSVSSQLSYLYDITKNESDKLGFSVVVAFFRRNEIIGHISGPLLIGLFINLMGLHKSILGLAIYISLSFLIFSIIFREKEVVNG